MWTLQPPGSLCAPHHAPCHACHVYPLWVHYKSQKTKDSLCFKQSYMYFERSKRRKTIFVFTCVFTIFCVLHYCPGIHLLTSWHFPSDWRAACGVPGVYIYQQYTLTPPDFAAIPGGRCLGAGSWWMVSISQHHCPWAPGSNYFKGRVELWLLPRFSLLLWFSVLISMMWAGSFICAV